MSAEKRNPADPIENLAIGKIIEVDGSRIIAELDLRDPLILSHESIRRNRSVEQTSPTRWTLHNVARPG